MLFCNRLSFNLLNLTVLFCILNGYTVSLMCTILFTHIKVVVLSGLAWFKQTSVIYD